jgi:hypothetical protein
MTLSVKGLSLSAGILFGLVVFAMTLARLWTGGGGHLVLLVAMYPGYKVSYPGSLIGLAYGFVSGAILGALLAWLYNKLGKQA